MKIQNYDPSKGDNGMICVARDSGPILRTIVIDTPYNRKLLTDWIERFEKRAANSNCMIMVD